MTEGKIIRKTSLGVQPGKFLQGLGGLAFQLRDELRPAIGDRYLDFLSTQPNLLQRISLSRIASWYRTRIVSNRLVNDK
ncbi:hypothetical protein [Nostoc favosum]|uniref:Uncharacterized protein n=1 Tax=Nostoc favosum CHAB5714 TaxID=2780399 RepID=A0ABS8IE96_9NOSO|nr:hypothetical protein [Nostoc favosum]MCC5602484.1 hypothetical protein [Nostoc favosum CHAB5714]